MFNVTTKSSSENSYFIYAVFCLIGDILNILYIEMAIHTKVFFSKLLHIILLAQNLEMSDFAPGAMIQLENLYSRSFYIFYGFILFFHLGVYYAFYAKRAYAIKYVKLLCLVAAPGSFLVGMNCLSSSSWRYSFLLIASVLYGIVAFKLFSSKRRKTAN